MRSRLLRALPKALALSRRAAGARAAARGDRTACRDIDAANLPDQRGSFDGFSVSTNARGEVSMNVAVQGYAIDVIIGGHFSCSDLDLPECPRPDGVLEGTDRHQSVIGLRVTKDGALVQSFRTTVRSTQKLRGEVAADAKLDQVKLEDTANETTTFAVPGATLTMRLTLLRTATLQMRSGTTTGAQVRVGFSISGGFTFADGITAAGRAADAYAQSFPELISEERGNYQRRESAWQTPGTCAKLTFSPASDTLRLRESQNGQVTGSVESNAGGIAAKAKWTVTSQANLALAPPQSDSPTQAFSYVVTRAGRNVRAAAGFKATSSAGVAEGAWSQPTEAPPEDVHFKVEKVTYNASHQGSFSIPFPCGGDGSATETLDVGPLAFDPEPNKLTVSGGQYTGGIGVGSVAPTGQRSGTNNGCVPVDPFPGCSVPFSIDVPVGIGVSVLIRSGSDRASVIWALPPIVIGGEPPPFECYAPPITAVPNPEEREEPAATFLEPGLKTIRVTRNVSLTGGAMGYSQAVSGTTVAEIQFKRVNADGSPFTG